MPKGVVGGNIGSVEGTIGAVGARGVSLYVAAVLADGPLGFWLMDESSGTTMFDSSGNGLHGTYTNAVPISTQFGEIKNARSFNGSNAHAMTPTLPLSILGIGAEVTIEFSLKAAWSGTSVIAEMSGYGSAVSGAATVAHDANLIHIGERYQSTYRSRNFTRPSSSVWHFFSVVWSMANGNSTLLSLRVNGSEVSGSGGVVGNYTGQFSDRVLWLMAREGVNYRLQGDMAGLAIYPTRLSNARRDSHYHTLMGIT